MVNGPVNGQLDKVTEKIEPISSSQNERNAAQLPVRELEVRMIVVRVSVAERWHQEL